VVVWCVRCVSCVCSLFQPDRSPEKEANEALHARIRSLQWLRPQHLDLPPTLFDDTRLSACALPCQCGVSVTCACVSGVAAEHLNKMDAYKTPRDKLICILNCCKILYGVAARAAASGTASIGACAPHRSCVRGTCRC
jgi:hypothetical protein